MLLKRKKDAQKKKVEEGNKRETPWKNYVTLSCFKGKGRKVGFLSSLFYLNKMEDKTIAPPTPQILTAPLPNTNDYGYTNTPTLIDYEQPEEHKETPGLLRAGLATKPRLMLMTSVGAFWGFSIGAFLGGQQSGLQYLAENAHKLPTTVQGWYFYHKTKNYRMMLGGVKRGLKFAGKTGGLCLLYGSLEAALDDIRGEADVVNSVTAGVATGTLFSTFSKEDNNSCQILFI